MSPNRPEKSGNPAMTSSNDQLPDSASTGESTGESIITRTASTAATRAPKMSGTRKPRSGVDAQASARED